MLLIFREVVSRVKIIKVIENKFTYHAPTEQQVKTYAEIRSKTKELAYLIQENCPDSNEKELAINKLEEFVMWANASIARNKTDERK